MLKKIYVFGCSNHDPNENHTLHLNMLLSLILPFPPLQCICCRSCIFCPVEDFTFRILLIMSLWCSLTRASSYFLLQKMSFSIALLLMYYMIQKGSLLISDTTCVKKLATLWTIISHVKGRSGWVSSTVVYPEVMKTFLKIHIQTCQLMALNTPKTIKGQVTALIGCHNYYWKIRESYLVHSFCLSSLLFVKNVVCKTGEILVLRLLCGNPEWKPGEQDIG